MGEGRLRSPHYTMKRYVYGNHPWLNKWVEEYHLENIMKNDIGGVCKLSWLLFTRLNNHKSRGLIYDTFKAHFESYGITITKNRKSQLVFHIDKKMQAWIRLQQ